MASYHVRSISLPSASHPLVVRIDELLERLKSSKSTSSSSICHNLTSLVELYDCVDDVLHLSQSQSHGKRVEEALDGSLRMLDLCGSIRDALSQMKQNVQELESSVRRKRGDSGFSDEVSTYMTAKKKLHKLISKSSGDLKRMEKGSNTTTDKDSLNSMFGEIEGVSFVVFDSLLSFISPKKGRSKSLSLVSKLLQSKNVSYEGEEDINEVEKLDNDLVVLKSKGSSRQVQNVVKKLQTLEMSIQGLEEGMETVFRRLVKTRVSLLNILNN